MTGSHIDTVRTGGRFDGNLGVLAGLEVVETLSSTASPPRVRSAWRSSPTRRAPASQPDMLGSLVYVGGMAARGGARRARRRRRRPARRRADAHRLRRPDCRARPPRAPHAYVELHIEQGPVLEDEGITIGVVTGVQGISWTELTITGQSAHAGTTPMRLRHDPGYVAAEIIAGVRTIARQMGGTQVATVGRCRVRARTWSTWSPSKVTLTVDLRNTDEARAAAGRGARSSSCADDWSRPTRACDDRTRARWPASSRSSSTPAMVDLVEATAQRLGHSTRRMPSGAGHDAQMLARVCPTSMIFVPSVNGLSHNIAEYTAARRPRRRRQRPAAGDAGPGRLTLRTTSRGRRPIADDPLRQSRSSTGLGQRPGAPSQNSLV